MAYVLDAVILMIFVFCAWNGARKGLVKTLSKLAAIVLAIVLAMLLCQPAAQWLADKKVGPSIQESVSESIAQAENNVNAGLQEAMDGLPAFAKNTLERNGITKLTVPAGTQDASAYVTYQVIVPVIFPLLKVTCFLVLFLVGGLVIWLVLLLIDKLCKLPFLRRINKSLGLVAGVVVGILWVFVAVTVMQMIAASADADAWLNVTTLDNTYLVKWLISLNPASVVLKEIGATVAHL